jgi:hypothetical protein
MSLDTDTRQLGTHGWLRLLVAAALVLVLILTLEASPAAGASREACRVTNAGTGRTHARLQQAVNAAQPGDRLVVKGVCRGGTFIDKDIAITGVKTRRTGKPVLDGDGKARVLTVKPTVKVSVRSLVIRDGKATRIPDGGGISNKGRLTLRDVVVRDNHAAGRGGGIHNEGVLRMQGRTVVKNNLGALAQRGSGSGVYNAGRLILADRSRITSNTGGSGVVNAGSLVMNGSSSISRSDFGRGVSGVTNSGDWTMNDSSSISDEGSLSNAGNLVMNDTSSIHHNRITGGMLGCDTGHGGGVHNSGSLTLNDSASIHHNVVWGGCGHHAPPYERARGGGVYNSGSLTMTGSSRIHTNEAMTDSHGVAGLGGGLYNASGGTLDGVNCAPQTYANVHGNTPDDCYFE